MAKWRHFIYRKRYGYLRYLLLFCALCPGFEHPEHVWSADGLQLCDIGASSSYGAAYCARLESGCIGGYSGRCHPYHIWSGSSSNSQYYAPYLVEGILRLTGPCNGGLCPASIAFSVRCCSLAGILPPMVHCVLDLQY